MLEYPKQVVRFNDLLRVELGHNPLYAWRWSGDLLHVMELIDVDGNPKYTHKASPEGLIILQPETATRLLLPNHPANWVVCALVEVSAADGHIHGTGTSNWVPVSSNNSGPAALPEGWEPTREMTDNLIRSVRQDRSRRLKDMTGAWEEDRRKREREHWLTIYEQIKDSNTAFHNDPGKKGSVSFPSAEVDIPVSFPSEERTV